MNKYLKFEYWNTCDLGNIYYQGGQHFIFYLDADVGEPIHEEVEEGQENGDGDFIPTYRRQMKRYRIRTGLIPDYLIDAIQRMKLHDHIELTFKSGEVEQIYNVDVEPEWQFEKYAWQGTVTLTFDMDESITVGACCDNLTVTDAIPEWYWIATDGSDDTGDGHYTTPWKTLAYACTQVTTPGDVIHLKAGNYTETSQCVLAAGVSIIGAGDTSVVTTGAALNPIILLASASEGTDGAQSISYIKIDGDLVADAGITVLARSNVSIHHVTIIDCVRHGIYINGRTSVTDSEATIYGTGNSIHNSIITNCGYDSYDVDANSYWAIGGCLVINSQQDILVYDNVLDNLTGGRYCYTIRGHHFRGNKIYNNNLSTQLRNVAGRWSGSFNIEVWTGDGGIEIYNNTCNGGIDLGGYGYSDLAGYGYAARVYDNTIILPTQETYNGGSGAEAGIIIESGFSGGTYVYRNYVRNFSVGITIGVTEESLIPGHTDVWIHHNILCNLGFTDSDVAAGISGYADEDAVDNLEMNNIYILNNVIHKSGNTSGWGIVFEWNLTNTIPWNNLVIRNNIIYNAYSPLMFENQTIDGINIDNNLIYGHKNKTIPDYNLSTVTNQTFANNLVGTDPEFVTTGSDFHLQAGSPCINAGIDVGLTTDYDGQVVSDPPEIGAYEYQE